MDLPVDFRPPDGACESCSRSLHVSRTLLQVYEFAQFEPRKYSVDRLSIWGYAQHEGSCALLTLHSQLLVAGPAWLDLLKFKCAALFAWANDQEIPAYPNKLADLKIPYGDSPHFLSGLFRRFDAYQRTRLRSGTKVARDFAASFFYSMLMAKKGFPRPDKRMLRQAEQDTFKALTTPQSIGGGVDFKYGTVQVSTDPDLSRLAQKCRDVVCHLTKSAGHLGRPHPHPEKDYPDRRFSLAFASVNSCYGGSRKGGGQLGALAGFYSQWYDNHARLEWRLLVDGSLYECIEPELRWWHCPGFEERGILAQDALVHAALAEDPRAQPLALAEALKVRTITKGPPVLNTVLRPLQKLLHSICASDERFVIGGPCTLDVLRSVFCTRSSGRIGDPASGLKWLSGDYKAATDNLNALLSTTIADEFSNVLGLDDRYRQLLQRSLCGHSMCRPLRKFEVEGPGDVLPQARGQLMGSITSFPVLCVANFALIWLAKEEAAGVSIPFDEVDVIVNGDDCLFPASANCKRIWERLAVVAGLTPSVGKTYYDDRFAVFNSILFSTDSFLGRAPVDYKDDVHRRGLDCVPNADSCPCRVAYCYEWTPRIIPYLNFNLLLSVGRSVGEESATKDDLPGARARAMLDGFDDPEQRRWIMANFVAECKRRPGVLPRRASWYWPEEFGGAGLPEVYPDFVMDRQDRRLLNGLLKGLSDKPELWSRVPVPSFGDAADAQSKMVEKVAFPHLFGRRIRDDEDPNAFDGTNLDLEWEVELSPLDETDVALRANNPPCVDFLAADERNVSSEDRVHLTPTQIVERIAHALVEPTTTGEAPFYQRYWYDYGSNPGVVHVSDLDPRNLFRHHPFAVNSSLINCWFETVGGPELVPSDGVETPGVLAQRNVIAAAFNDRNRVAILQRGHEDEDRSAGILPVRYAFSKCDAFYSKIVRQNITASYGDWSSYPTRPKLLSRDQVTHSHVSLTNWLKPRFDLHDLAELFDT